MSTLRLALFSVVALGQIALPAHSIFMRVRTLAQGRVWKLKAAPIDPVDALRGRYVTLAFAAETVPRAEALPNQSEAYAILKEGTDGFAVVDRLSPTPVSGDNVIQVKTNGFWSGVQRVQFPFKRFWLDEKSAPAAERAYVLNSRGQKQNAFATVRVRKGDAALEQLYISDLTLAEYLRLQSTQSAR